MKLTVTILKKKKEASFVSLSYEKQMYTCTPALKTLMTIRTIYFAKIPLDNTTEFKNVDKMAGSGRNSTDPCKSEVISSPKAKNYKWKCNVCGLSLHARTHLETHMRIHTGEKPFICHICSKSFRRMYDLQLHLHTHSGIKPYGCPFCGEKFNHKSNHRRHIKRHHSQPEKPKHVCGLCKEEFYKKKILQEHMRIKHEGVKQLTCKTCKKQFANWHDLTVHFYTHTSENSFVCEICSKRFGQKSVLDMHIKSHEG